jgi:hypothetical protein
MDLKAFLDLAHKEWSVFSGAPILILALIGLVFVMAWRLRGSIDSGQAEGLKAQLDARNERLVLADERRKDVETTAERLERQVVVLLSQVEQEASPITLQASTASIQSTVTALSTANTALHEALDLSNTNLALRSTGEENS